MAGRGSSTASAFDITDLKQTEEALQEERNVLSAILDTVGALVVVLDPRRPHRALQPRLRTDHRLYFRRSQRASMLWELFADAGRGGTLPEHLRTSCAPDSADEYESHWITRDGGSRLDLLVRHGPGRTRRARPLTSLPPESTLPSASGWSRRSSKSARASSGASARICTTDWASI